MQKKKFETLRIEIETLLKDLTNSVVLLETFYLLKIKIILKTGALQCNIAFWDHSSY